MSNVAKGTNVKKTPFVLNLKSDFQAASFNGSTRKCPACSITTSPTPMFLNVCVQYDFNGFVCLF